MKKRIADGVEDKQVNFITFPFILNSAKPGFHFIYLNFRSILVYFDVAGEERFRHLRIAIQSPEKDAIVYYLVASVETNAFPTDDRVQYLYFFSLHIVTSGCSNGASGFSVRIDDITHNMSSL